MNYLFIDELENLSQKDLIKFTKRLEEILLDSQWLKRHGFGETDDYIPDLEFIESALYYEMFNK